MSYIKITLATGQVLYINPDYIEHVAAPVSPTAPARLRYCGTNVDIKESLDNLFSQFPSKPPKGVKRLWFKKIFLIP